LMFLVEEHMSRDILETIDAIGKFDKRPGTGIAFQLDVEDAVGVTQQISKLSEAVEEKL
ncbi:MAG: P-II family nitrogen regulator, partial [Gammaproteobacteria bacterium]